MNAITPMSRLSTGVRKVRWSTEQFFAMDRMGAFADFNRAELLNGEIHSMNAQLFPHTRAQSRLHIELHIALRAAESSLSAVVEGTVELSPKDAPIPDISIIDETGISSKIPASALKIAIEVADSTERHDLGPKLRIYAGAGVPEYWVAVLRTRTIERFSDPDTAGKSYRAHDSFSFGEAVPCATLVGVLLPAGVLVDF